MTNWCEPVNTLGGEIVIQRYLRSLEEHTNMKPLKLSKNKAEPGQEAPVQGQRLVLSTSAQQLNFIQILHPILGPQVQEGHQ